MGRYPTRRRRPAVPSKAAAQSQAPPTRTVEEVRWQLEICAPRKDEFFRALLKHKWPMAPDPED